MTTFKLQSELLMARLLELIVNGKVMTTQIIDISEWQVWEVQ